MINKQFSDSDVQELFDAELWPMILTYIVGLAKVKADLHAKDEGRRSNGSAVRVVTDRWTDGMDASKCIIFLAPYSTETPKINLTYGIRITEKAEEPEKSE